MVASTILDTSYPMLFNQDGLSSSNYALSQGLKAKLFTKHQESARMDVKRAFGVL